MVDTMSNKISRVGTRIIFAALLALCPFGAINFAAAANSPVVTGTYDVVQNTGLGEHEQVRLRIHLVNHTSSNLSIRRMMLWDLSRPEKGATRPCAISLAAHASADTTMDFTIPRLAYEQWQRGERPRLVLQLANSAKGLNKTVVRLDRAAPEVK
jgi:hypothetical protein